MAARLWKFEGGEIDFQKGAVIMGVLNVTPDSFSDGGEFFEPGKAIEQGMRLATEGARVIDIGGESTRPGSAAVSVEEELERVLPVVSALSRSLGDTFLSIDTTKAAVAHGAMEVGAAIVNDITGGTGDQEMLPLVAKRGAGFIIVHMQGTPQTMQNEPHYEDVVAEVRDFFRQQYARALECGIDSMAIAFDPGIGFGKTGAHNLELLRRLPELRVADRPLVVGVSRKAFLGKMVESAEMADRLAPTIALTALLRERGADVVRVHDVKANVGALKMAEGLGEQ
ncbi:MAG: dihydropteroate synthase [Chthoniobacterales bacterium]